DIEVKAAVIMDRLKADYPWTKAPLVCGGPMRLIALASLATEISRAGGLGFVGAGSDVSNLGEILEEVQRLKASAQVLREVENVLPGQDAGGHGLDKAAGLIPLLPEVDDAVTDLCRMKKNTKPVLIATGGIMDGRGTAAAIALGASGVTLGTRYLAAPESNIAKGYRDAVLKAGDGGVHTKRVKLYDTLRGTRDWPERYGGRGVLNESFYDSENGVSLEENQRMYDEALKKGDEGWGEHARLATYAGAGVGLVKAVKSAARITEEMAAAAESPFDQLKSCSQDTRRKVFHQLWRDGQIKRNGFTVYQYHVVPAILEEQRVWTPSAMSVHYAEIRAGLRWSYTDREQEDFWRRQTQILLSGNIAPLQPATFKGYLQGRYDAIVESPPESNGAAVLVQQSEPDLESAPSDSEASVQLTLSQPSPEISERDSDDDSISASADGETAPASTSPACTSPISAVEITQDDSASSTSGSGAFTADSMCLAETAPSYAQIASSNPPATISTDPAKPTNPCMAFPAHKLRCEAPSTPSMLRAPAPSAIQRLVEELGPLEQGHRKLWGGCRRLDAMIQEKGFTLFEHHVSALARRGCEAALEANNEPGRFASIWRTMPEHEKVQWSTDTASLKTGLQKGQKGVLIHFDTEVPNNRQRRYRTQALAALHAYLRDKCSAPIQLDRSSVIEMLLGTPYEGLDEDVLIQAISRSITERVQLDSNLQLAFRWRGARICFSSTTMGLTTHRERIKAVMSHGLTISDIRVECQDRIKALEDLLKPLVHFNRDSVAFDDMTEVKVTEHEAEQYCVDASKSLQWAQECLKFLRPLKPQNKHTIEWNLATDTHGLAAKLLSCFGQDGLNPGEYEDLMEQTMWAFFKTEPDLAAEVNPFGTRTL
ncbi:Nitronate monooxygenase, partial [Pseudocercospora fuligena]